MTEYPSWPRRLGLAPGESRAQETSRHKAVRIHGMADPLGAAGFRQSRIRVQREGQARRLAAVGAIASFVASLALIVWNAPQAISPSDPPLAISGNTIAPAAITQDQSRSLGANPAGIGREPTPAPIESHTRTRSSD